MAKQHTTHTNNSDTLLIDLFFGIGILLLKNLFNDNNIDNQFSALGKLINNIFSSLFGMEEKTSKVDNISESTQKEIDSKSLPKLAKADVKTNPVATLNLPAIASSSLGGIVNESPKPENYWQNTVKAQKSSKELEPSMQID